MKYFDKNIPTEEKKVKTMKKMGERIKRIRKGKKLTQKQFIELLEIKGGSSLISGVENGKRSLPASVLPIIAEMGNTSVESLFSDSFVVRNIEQLIINPAFNTSDFSKREQELFMNYMSHAVQKATNNLGILKIFDILFAVLWYGSQENGAKNYLYEELPMILEDDYRDRRESRYSRFIVTIHEYGKNA